MNEKKNIDTLFKKLENSEPSYFPNKENIWEKIEQGLDENNNPSQKKYNFKPWMMAAGFVVLGVIGWFFWNDTATLKSPESTPTSEVSKPTIVYQDTLEQESSMAMSEASNAKQQETERAETLEEYKDIIRNDQLDQLYAVEDAEKKKSQVYSFKIDKNRDYYNNSSGIFQADSITLNTNNPIGNSLDKVSSYPVKPNKEISVDDDFEGTQNLEYNVPVEEVAVNSRTKNVKEKDFYFIDGKRVKKSELKRAEDLEEASLNYLSHEDAATLGYISIYKDGNVENGEVTEVIFWKDLKVENLEKLQYNSVYQQLDSIDTSNFSNSDKKVLQKLKVNLKEKINNSAK